LRLETASIFHPYPLIACCRRRPYLAICDLESSCARLVRLARDSRQPLSVFTFITYNSRRLSGPPISVGVSGHPACETSAPMLAASAMGLRRRRCTAKPGVAKRTPGRSEATRKGTLKGFDTAVRFNAAACGRVVQRLRHRTARRAIAIPGCAARPWAVGCNPFGIGSDCRRRGRPNPFRAVRWSPDQAHAARPKVSRPRRCTRIRETCAERATRAFCAALPAPLPGLAS
jgi:hypothetical protein